MPRNNNNNQEQISQRRRSRQDDGKFRGENPNAPDLNIAWEPIEAEAALPKETKYTVKPKVTGTSQGLDTAGKYKQKPTIKPGLGSVSTAFY